MLILKINLSERGTPYALNICMKAQNLTIKNLTIKSSMSPLFISMLALSIFTLGSLSLVSPQAFARTQSQTQTQSDNNSADRAATAELNRQQMLEWQKLPSLTQKINHTIESLSVTQCPSKDMEEQSEQLELLARLPLPATEKNEAYGLTHTQIQQSNLDTFLLNECQMRHWGDDFDCKHDIFSSKKAALSQCENAGGSAQACTQRFYQRVAQMRADWRAARGLK